MRFFILAGLAAFLFTGNVSFAGEEKEKGAMERAGSAIDSGVQKTKDFFSDSAITTRVKTRLFRDDYVSGLHTKIKTKNGICIVSGEAESEKLARRVMDIVRATRGVKGAENHMIIVTKTSSQVK